MRCHSTLPLSGVATLSCSDSSALSSSGTSDITEPRSPFSTTSNHSSECSDDSSGVPSPGKLSYLTPPVWDPSCPTQWQPADGSPQSSKKRTHQWSSEVPICEENDSDARTSPWKLTKRCSAKSMAPNVPSSQEGGDHWPWSGKELETDEGPPLPPPPLVAPSTPLTPVTANIIANVPPKSLKHQTAIVNQKTAIAKDVTAVPSSKRTPEDVTSVPNSKRLRVEQKSGKQLLPRNKNSSSCSNAGPAVARKFPEQCVSYSRRNIPTAHKKTKCGSINNSNNTTCVKTIATGASNAGDRTQDKNASGVRKNVSTSEFRCPSVQPLGKNCARETKMRGNEVSDFFPSASTPHAAAAEDKTGTKKASHQAAEARPWDRFDMSPRTAKIFQKIAEPKNGSLPTLPHTRKVFSKLLPAPKNVDLNRNGINVSPSQSRASEKLDLLLASPSSAKLTVLLAPVPKHNNSVAKLAKPESLSNSVVCSKICSSLLKPLVPIVDVGKNGSQDVSDASPKAKVASEKEPLVVSSSPSPSERSSSTSGVCESEAAACLPPDVAESSPATSLTSPILSAPRTIRFPAADRTVSSSSGHGSQQDQLEGAACKWSECSACFDSSTGLLEHLQTKHVNAQVPSETYVCLWVGCKVYGRMSCSNTWLERHVLSHGGNKVLRCIFDDCSQRFSSQITLQRHVNSHFSETGGASGGIGARRNVDSTNSKLFRRNGKKLRYRRQPWSARMFDYFDCGIMERLQFQLMKMTQTRTLGNVAGAPGNTMSFRSRIMARRTEKDGSKKVLLRWFPTDILDDEWVTERDARAVQDVPICSLPTSATDQVHTALFGSDDRGTNATPLAAPVRRRGRKPVKSVS
ncbi:zinc finger protein jing isoform X2 [Bacillus rossius redtenbacheri]|uniref:zinc finger protein jing isoform X2 n=1 Tax=Bacillus rossius redtenbacheri TaxID=93214 RepID=UPI002FDEC891